MQSILDHVPENQYRPLRPIDGFLPLEDFGLLGDGTTAALVGRDGTVAWLCLPYFDSPPFFASILDARRGGAFRMAPINVVDARQAYVADSGVLVTDLRTPSAQLRVVDALTFRTGTNLCEDAPASRGELVRSARVVYGDLRLRVEIDPFGDAVVRQGDACLEIRSSQAPQQTIQLHCSRPMGGKRDEFELHRGDRIDFILRWGAESHGHRSPSADAQLKATVEAWRSWMTNFAYQGPEEGRVRRSAITLKMLDYFENGAMVAAPTSSLPEAIGGVRNWDYRYVWIRDAAFSVYALRRIGMGAEAGGFLSWVLDAIEHEGNQPRVLYTIHGKQPAAEHQDTRLEGYRRSAPVRWGNAAADQRQHDVYGEILDCAYQWSRGGGDISDRLWKRLRQYIEAAADEWKRDDHGIWEVRTRGHPFTYSAALCHVALKRGAKLAERLGLPGEPNKWLAEAERIREAILTKAWCEKRNSLTEHLNGGGLDASLLTLPLRRVVDATHPKMKATTEAVAKHLGAGDGLVYRYLPEESPDGLPGHEGAFLLCSFWLVDNLALQGRREEAEEMYCSLCGRSGPLGLLPEQIDPSTGSFLGNFPQAFSHVGLISSGVTLARLAERDRAGVRASS